MKNRKENVTEWIQYAKYHVAQFAKLSKTQLSKLWYKKIHVAQFAKLSKAQLGKLCYKKTHNLASYATKKHTTWQVVLQKTQK